jgi:hypothetical protein
MRVRHGRRKLLGTVLAGFLLTAAVAGCGPSATTSPGASPTEETTPTASVATTSSVAPSSTATPPPTPRIGTFVATGSLVQVRQGYAACSLEDGRVLFVGGFKSTGGELASAEIYDPATKTFSLTGSMHTGRVYASATLLTDSRVLVAGGEAGTTPLASAELFNPGTGTFSVTGSMTVPREYHTATRLENDLVLIAGGMSVPNIDTAVASAELFNPATGTFTATGSMKGIRQEHTATLLDGGKVLVVGGVGGPGPGPNTGTLATAELYDPGTGKWSQTGSLAEARWGNTETKLADGRVLVASGSMDPAYPASAEIYNPTTGTWSKTGALGTARWWHTATRLADGRVLITGGDTVPQGQAATPIRSAELFDPASGTFISAGSMVKAREGHTAAMLPSGSVLLAGNSTDRSAELYVP